MKNWTGSIIKGVRKVGYDLVISTSELTHCDAAKFTQVLLTMPVLSGRTFIIVPEYALHTSLVCVLTMHDLLDPVAVLGSLHCSFLCQ